MKLRRILENGAESSAKKADMASNKKAYAWNSYITIATLCSSFSLGMLGVVYQNKQETIKRENAPRIEAIEKEIGKPCAKDYVPTTKDKLNFGKIVKQDVNADIELRMKLGGLGSVDFDDLPKTPVFCQVLEANKVPENALVIEYLALMESQKNLIDPVLAAALGETLLIALYVFGHRKMKYSDREFLTAKLKDLIKKIKNRNAKDKIEENLAELKELEAVFQLLVAREDQLVSEIKSELEPVTPYRDSLSREEKLVADGLKQALAESDFDKALAYYRGEAVAQSTYQVEATGAATKYRCDTPEPEDIEEDAEVEEDERTHVVPGRFTREKY